MHSPDRMIPCPSCDCFIRASERRCPLCNGAFSADRKLTVLAAAMLAGATLTGCVTGQALYGVADTSMFVDDDDDGFTIADGDCDDADPAINPDAEETAGDGVDSNCDGDDDT